MGLNYGDYWAHTKPQLIKMFIRENDKVREEKAKHEKTKQLAKHDIKGLNTTIARLERELGGKIQEKKSELSNTRFKVRKLKYEKSQYVDQKREIRKELHTLLKEVAFLNGTTSWDSDEDPTKHIEIIVRAIVAYTSLINDGITTYNEMLFLLIGAQREFFSIKDIADKATWVLNRNWKSQFHKCKEAGYFEKVYRKQLFYITVAGKDRFREILKHIYTVNIGSYKEVKKILEDFERVMT